MTQALMRILALFFALLSTTVFAEENRDYPLGPGDVLRVQVFQNPDLTTETRVSESGVITYPLIGNIEVGGLPITDAEKKIAAALKNGGFVRQPQVNIVVLQMHGNQVSVLGQVNRPGRFPLETVSRVSDMLAMAGGATITGDDSAIVIGLRDGKPFRKVIDIPALYLNERSNEDIILTGGGTLSTCIALRSSIFMVKRSGRVRTVSNEE